jgi:hypothetical protein
MQLVTASKGKIVNRKYFPLMVIGSVIIACNSTINILQQPITSLFGNNVGTLTVQVKTNVLETAYNVIARPNPENDLLTDIYIKSISSEEEIFLITLDDVNREHYHLGEYHNGNLYIIKKVEIVEEQKTEWEEELWKYDVNGIGERLWNSTKGLDYRVAPNEKIIAIQSEDIIWFDEWDNYLEILKPLYVYPNIKYKLKENTLGIDYMEYYTKQLDKWSDNGQIFWGEFKYDSTPVFIIMFDSTTLKVREFDISHQKVGIEFELNANTGKLVYSNYPRMETEEEEIIFRNGEKEVKLFLFDLLRLTQRVIATSTAKEFHPKWLNDTTIEYDDPLNEGKRIVLIDS